MPKTDWATAIQPLLKKYKGKPHPLEYRNIYQLLAMMVLSAQDSDKDINNLAPALFEAFPNMEALAEGKEETLLPYVKKVRGHRKKIDWLISIARELKTDANIPLVMQELVKLKGIGRKSANEIMREAGVKAEGIVVDLHVVRVAPRLGITKSSDPKKIEADLMKQIDPKVWGDAGMAISFLGRETCRPTHPEHQACVMSDVCDFFQKQKKKSSVVKPGKKTSQKSARTIVSNKKVKPKKNVSKKGS